MSRSITVEGTPYSYDAEATAGISLGGGDPWWGTLVKWRPGLAGRWNRVTLVDVHPFDTEAVEAALRAWISKDYTTRGEST